MTRVSLGDASLTNMLARQGVELRSQVQRASQEVATGRHSDIGAVLGGDLSPLLAIDASLTRLRAFATTTSEAATQTAAQQGALAGLSGLTSDVTATLLRARDVATPIQVNALGADMRGRLASAVGLVNTQTAGRAIFGGVETRTTPLGTSEDMLAALATASAGATTADQVVSAVRDWFADPAGYGAFYRGGAPLSPAPIAPGESAELTATALDPAIRDTLAGIATAALLDLGVLAGNSDERARLAQRSGEALLSSSDSRVGLAARIGSVEAQIETARIRNAAEESALGIVRANVGSVDPFDAATRLEAARSQLESLYLVTARVSRLSLVEFLR